MQGYGCHFGLGDRDVKNEIEFFVQRRKISVGYFGVLDRYVDWGDYNCKGKLQSRLNNRLP